MKSMNNWVRDLRCFDGMMSRGQGIAYKCTDKRTNELAVIKKYGNLGDEKAKSAFEKESGILKNLKSRHIVRYYDSFITKDKEYWVALLWCVH